jgi:hypothetical protein
MRSQYVTELPARNTKPAYPLSIASIGTVSRRVTVAMAKTVKYAG